MPGSVPFARKSSVAPPPVDTKENFPGEEPPKQTPWGIGKFTRDGCNYIYRQLMKECRCSSTL